QSIESLLAGGYTPSTLVTLMLQHFMSLYLVKNGKPPVGNRNFLIPKFNEQARRFDQGRLEQIVLDIADTDAELRRTRFKPDMALEMLALRLMGERRRADG
ncbi:MAG: hypothetical protein AB1744_06810, partial [Candidatus Zixiibacteriota bacterium]